MKKPFITKKQAEEIREKYPTPFHIYDEKGIRENARSLSKAFSWNKGFKEYFAVKATPNPSILKILKEEGCGVDCSSLTELMMADMCGFEGADIMFSSNVTPEADYRLAGKMNAVINLDDITHIDYLNSLIGIPETIGCRFNPRITSYNVCYTKLLRLMMGKGLSDSLHEDSLFFCTNYAGNR